MVHYYKTTGIYADSNLLRIEVTYDKGRGYVAQINPCHKDEHSWGILYNKEYYNHYNTLSCMLVPCGRKNAKKEQEAYEIMKAYMKENKISFKKLFDDIKACMEDDGFFDLAGLTEMVEEMNKETEQPKAKKTPQDHKKKQTGTV